MPLIGLTMKSENDMPNNRTQVLNLLADLSKRGDETSRLAAVFIRKTAGIANTIEAQGWAFEPGHDLIEDILNPIFLKKRGKVG